MVFRSGTLGRARPLTAAAGTAGVRCHDGAGRSRRVHGTIAATLRHSGAGGGRCAVASSAARRFRGAATERWASATGDIVAARAAATWTGSGQTPLTYRQPLSFMVKVM